MNQRFRVLQELGEQFERANERPRATGERFAVVGSRLHAGRKRFWAAAGAAGGTAVAAVVAAVLLLSAGTPAADAGWAAVPSTANPAAVTAAIKKCYEVGAINHGLGRPVLTEARGRSTGAITLVDGTVYMCLYDRAFSAVSTSSMGPLRAAPGPRQLSVPYGEYGGGSSAKLPKSLFEAMRHRPLSRATRLELLRFRAGDGYGYWALGQAGRDVSAVRFSFNGHQTVTATVEHGWYFAWWPWTSDPTSVTVTAGAGTSTSPMTNTWPDRLGSRPYPACRPGSNGCVFAKTEARASTPPASPVVAATQDCDAATLSSGVLPADAFTGPPVVTQDHGVYTAVINVTSRRVYGCLIGGNQKNVHAFYMQDITAFGRVRPTPAPDQISIPYTEQNGFGSGRPIGTARARNSKTDTQRQARRERLGGGYGPYTLGQAGTNVTAITFTFANGKTIAATIQHGWYFAWWPWVSSPTSITVSTKSGTTTSRLQNSDNPRTAVTPGCRPATTGCVFAQK